MSAVRIDHISKIFGEFAALNDVSLSVATGERRAIIGPNGAGKTTLFSIVAGQKMPTKGDIYINHARTTGLEPFALWRHGVSRTFQRNQLMLGLTVWENVELACAAHHPGIFAAQQSRVQRYEAVAETLQRVDLLDAHATKVVNLSYGEQRQLELALALAGQPKILLLDEPTAGMGPAETESMLKLMCALPREMTILIVEHDMDVVFSLADRVTVLNLGEVLADGTVEEIRADPRVSAVYMGKDA